jgi:hypothetical protein
MLVKTVHIGGINLGKENMATVFQAKRQKLIYELNDWIFEYQYAHQYPIQQLPPLDDWMRSQEDATCWYVHFPDPEWTVWVRSSIIEF